jgi:plastocyanin
VLITSGAITLLPQTPASAAALVKGIGTNWSPTRTNILRGGSVRWKAVSGTHQVKAYGGNWTFQSHLLAPGQITLARTFGSRGTFRFFCTIHGSVTNGVCSGMCGKIVVS